ncbi:MAG: hypothetical protein K0S41_2154 [Anaerocolumna sp.]|jgi:catalase|nr:hypothetical protein [Anaerocolumna sp.]
MKKGKLCSLAIASMISIVSMHPITTFAADTNSKSETLSEMNRNQEKKAAFEKKMQKAREQWNKLTKEQKEEIYSIIENEMNVESQLMDKLVEFGVMDKDDVALLKARMSEAFNKMKESGEFPFSRQKGR